MNNQGAHLSFHTLVCPLISSTFSKHQNPFLFPPAMPSNLATGLVMRFMHSGTHRLVPVVGCGPPPIVATSHRARTLIRVVADQVDRKERPSLGGAVVKVAVFKLNMWGPIVGLTAYANRYEY